MNQVGILGCGWLGTPLAAALKELDFSVRASRTSAAGALNLEAEGFESYQVLVTQTEIQGATSFFDSLEQIVISLPPGRKAAFGFSEKIKTLVQFLESNTRCRILFLSSISVYGQTGIFEESSSLSPQSQSALELQKSEQILLNSRAQVVIIRLGGLIGSDRNPIFHLINKPISNPKGRINFIHQKDAIRGIVHLIKQPELKGIYNLVCPHHPEREEYYKKMAQKFNLSAPVFQIDDAAQKRVVKAAKIQEHTGFEYQVDNLLT
jgi:nucleoside-diphosphate-sugar epimerase